MMPPRDIREVLGALQYRGFEIWDRGSINTDADLVTRYGEFNTIFEHEPVAVMEFGEYAMVVVGLERANEGDNERFQFWPRLHIAHQIVDLAHSIFLAEGIKRASQALAAATVESEKDPSWTIEEMEAVMGKWYEENEAYRRKVEEQQQAMQSGLQEVLGGQGFVVLDMDGNEVMIDAPTDNETTEDEDTREDFH